MGGRLVDWLGAGVASSLPDPVTDMPGRIVSNSVALYFGIDNKHLYIYDESVPNWYDLDLAAIAGISTESIQDMIAAFLSNGSGISLAYNDAGNLLAISCTVTQYTDEMAQDAIAALIAAGTDTGLAIVYDDAGNKVGFTINVAANTDIWGGTADDKFITPKRLKDWRTPVSVTDAATITLDGSTGVNFYVTLGGNRILANPTNFSPGQFGVIHVTQDGTGTRTLTFGVNWKFGSTSIAGNVLSVTAGATDAIHYYVRSDGTITSFIVQNLTGSPARLKLDDLSNVNISAPSNGQVLTYDSATSKWKNAAASGGGGGGGIYPTPVAPVDSNYGWLNQGTSTITTETDGSLTLFVPKAASLNARGRSRPVSGTWTYTAGMVAENDGYWNYSSSNFGIWAHDSATGKLILFGMDMESSGYFITAFRWANFTTTAGNIASSRNGAGLPTPIYLRMKNDGTTISFQISRRGVRYVTWVTEAVGFYVNPTSVGFFAYENGNALDMYINVFHETLTSP